MFLSDSWRSQGGRAVLLWNSYTNAKASAYEIACGHRLRRRRA